MKIWIRLLAISAIGAGCGTSVSNNPPPAEKDLVFVFPEIDLAGLNPSDDGGVVGDNDCSQFDPMADPANCHGSGFGPDNGSPFPLSTDMPKDPNESDNGIGRDKNGWLGLNQTMASFDYLWPANTGDYNRGTVSKFDSKTVREIARYMSVTCNSLGKGDRSAACDGKNGCCAMDSYPQWQNRKNKMAPGPYQQINLMTNYPSRTSVDFNGDLWVNNRAFGVQSSATKIANDPSDCIDRNGNGKIDTSKDVNGDGVINTDCNGNGQPDDIKDVKGQACSNGMAQEFYGLDDECILMTTNTGPTDQWGRPLSLGPGRQDFGPSDAWAGTYNDGHFYRIDGKTGLVTDEADLPQSCQPYGLVVDSSGFGWSPNLSSPPLCFFDTKNTKTVGTTRNPTVGQLTGYGVSLDRDQQIWIGCLGFGVCRYTPDRSNNNTKLDMGGWTMFSSVGSNGGGGEAIGVAVDARTPNQYWGWATGGNVVVRIPGSDTPPAKPMVDTLVDGSMYPTVQIAGNGKGVGVDRDQNIWNVAQGQAIVTKITVDVKGMMTAPNLNGQPMGNNKCPAGDTCSYDGMGNPSPYTYSDFTGFGLRTFTRPTGSYAYIQKGCDDQQGMPDSGKTSWLGVTWDADVPLNTILNVHARSGNTPIPDNTWGAWTNNFTMSPADLEKGGLMPNLPVGSMDTGNDGYLQVEFQLQTNVKNATPKLKSFKIIYECPPTIG
jgi:hypothetical protein